MSANITNRAHLHPEASSLPHAILADQPSSNGESASCSSRSPREFQSVIRTAASGKANAYPAGLPFTPTGQFDNGSASLSEQSDFGQQLCGSTRQRERGDVGGVGTRLRGAMLEAQAEAALWYWLDPDRTITDAHHYACDVYADLTDRNAACAKGDMPKRSTLRGMIDAIDRVELRTAKYGRSAADHRTGR